MKVLHGKSFFLKEVCKLCILIKSSTFSGNRRQETFVQTSKSAPFFPPLPSTLSHNLTSSLILITSPPFFVIFSLSHLSILPCCLRSGVKFQSKISPHLNTETFSSLAWISCSITDNRELRKDISFYWKHG